MKITIKPGVTMELTPPYTYEVGYLNGKQTYTEPFVIINFTKQAADSELRGFRTLIDGMAAFFVTTGAGGAAASMGISVAAGAILALITKIAGPLIEQKLVQTNPDGSISQYMAYHYWGNSAEGIDPTAWPIPGVDPQIWFNHVNSNIRAFQTARPKKRTLDIAAVGGNDVKPHYEFDVPEPLDFASYDKNHLRLPLANSLQASPADITTLNTDDSTFSQRFSGCMSSQGLPVPSSLFGTVTAAVATINSIYALVSTYGSSITIAELIGAGLLSDALLVAGGMTAAYYLGACIGCGIHAGVGHLIPGE